MTPGRLRHLLRLLRRNHPTAYPVKVRRVTYPSTKCWGQCALGDGYFTIHINRRLPALLQEIVLLHEWAHAMTWECDATDHGAVWAERFAGLIRWYQEEDEWGDPDEA